MIYLDNAATTKMSLSAFNAYELACKEFWGNVSSQHNFGKSSNKLLDYAINTICNIINCKSNELIFTSGATEGNNMIINSITDLGVSIDGLKLMGDVDYSDPDVQKANQEVLRKYIREFNDLNVIKEKDYVTHPKESGYTSYHMIVEVPILLEEYINSVKVEIQIRSLAMDFWASLEHKIKYKPNGEINEDVSKELVKCARDINKLDNKMVKLFKK